MLLHAWSRESFFASVAFHGPGDGVGEGGSGYSVIFSQEINEA